MCDIWFPTFFSIYNGQLVTHFALFGLLSGFREGLDSLKYLEILSQDLGENKSEHSNERRSRQIASRLV